MVKIIKNIKIITMLHLGIYNFEKHNHTASRGCAKQMLYYNAITVQIGMSHIVSEETLDNKLIYA